MNKEREIGLLEQLEIACIRPKKYNELLQNKKSKRWQYMIVLAFLLVFIELVIPVLAWDVSVGGLKNFMEKDLPKFEISQKGLSIEESIEIEVPGFIKIVVDPSKKVFTKKEAKEEYPSQVLISKSNALILNRNLSRNIIFSRLGKSVLNNEALVSIIPMLRLMFAVYVAMFILAKIIAYLWWVVIFALICRSVVKTKDGRMVTMSQAFELSFYARTLSAIISSVNTCLGGYFDGLTLVIASIFLTMGYIRLGEVSVLNNGAMETENKS